MSEIEIRVDDSFDTLPDHPWKETTEWFEYTYAVKWFAVQAYQKDELVGFMHVFRNPEDVTNWYFCDVHTLGNHKRQGIASKMYEKAISLVYQYDKAFRITASIHRDNIASIRLHEKYGFRDTGVASSFPGMIFEPEETLYEYYFAFEYPAKNTEIHRNHLKRLGELYCTEADKKNCKGIHTDGGKIIEDVAENMVVKRLWSYLEESEQNEKLQVFLFWAGDQTVGYRVVLLTENGQEKVLEEYICTKWKEHAVRGCLHVVSPS